MRGRTMAGDEGGVATGRPSPTFAIVAILLAGVLAGAQLGKIAHVVVWYQGELGLSLTVIGWLTAILGVFVAAVALPAGLVIDRWGLRPSFTSSGLFASLPSLTADRGSSAIALGLLAQAGGIGTLVGPPIAGWAIESAGWGAMGGLLAAAAVGAIALLISGRGARLAALAGPD